MTLSERISHDPDDDKFILCAVAGGADYIISGDRDLLSISSYKDIRIITPGEFIDLLP